jgi:hypothetical protein
MRYTPFLYQQFAEDFIIANKGAGLLLDMGFG